MNIYMCIYICLHMCMFNIYICICMCICKCVCILLISVHLQPNSVVNRSFDIDLKWIRTSSLFSASGAPFVQFLLFYNLIMTGHPLLSACSLLNLCSSAVLLCYISIYSFVHVLHFLSLLFCPCLSLFLSSVFNPISCFLQRFSKYYTDLPENPCRISFSHNILGNSVHAEFMSLENSWLNRQDVEGLDVEGLNVEQLKVIANFNLILSNCTVMDKGRTPDMKSPISFR